MKKHMTFDQAVEHYQKAAEAEFAGNGVIQQPSTKHSKMGSSGRWILRNTNGFLAYVTSSGKVLDSKFQQIGE